MIFYKVGRMYQAVLEWLKFWTIVRPKRMWALGRVSYRDNILSDMPFNLQWMIVEGNVGGYIKWMNLPEWRRGIR